MCALLFLVLSCVRLFSVWLVAMSFYSGALSAATRGWLPASPGPRHLVRFLHGCRRGSCRGPWRDPAVWVTRRPARPLCLLMPTKPAPHGASPPAGESLLRREVASRTGFEPVLPT